MNQPGQLNSVQLASSSSTTQSNRAVSSNLSPKTFNPQEI